MSKNNLIDSFNNAIEGFIYLLGNERNIRIHFLIGFIVLISAILLGLDLTDFLFLLITIFTVLFTEIVNTAVESILDLLHGESSAKVKIIKDVAASGVFISSLFAAVIAYLIFIPYLKPPFEKGLTFLKLSSWHIAFISFLTVLMLVIIGKVFFHKGKPLRGGMPSGHSAVAFSIWTIIVLVQSDILVTVLVLVLAVIIARSRVKYAVHTFWEVFTGSALGLTVTLLLYSIFLK